MKRLIAPILFILLCALAQAQPSGNENLNLPNVITPNNDGKNDTFYVGEFTLETAPSLVVLNRFGKVIFESERYLNNWDATQVDAGQYFYSVRFQEGAQESGSVTILK